MEKLSETIHQTLTTTNLSNDTYTGKDGLLYCAGCHTLRETKEIVPIINKRMPVPCQCMRDKEKAEKERKEQDKKMERLNELRSASLIGERYKNTTFENTDLTVGGNFVKAYDRCKNYCAISDDALKNGYGIYLFGESGTGKTHLTACICNELISQYKPCLFTNFFEISKLIKQSWSKNVYENTLQKFCDVDFLILDDLGTEILQKNGADNWLQEQVFDIINKRYNNCKPTIFSSNYSLKELVEDRGMASKTVDRIGEMSTVYIKVEGTSYRVKKRKSAIF